MSILPGILVFAALIAAVVFIVFTLRRRPGDIWEWSEVAYEPVREPPIDAPRAITRIRSRDIYWEIQ